MNSGCRGGVLKAAVISSASRLRGKIRRGVATDGKNVTPWWNHWIKDVIRAKKVAYKIWLQKKTNLRIRGT